MTMDLNFADKWGMLHKSEKSLIKFLDSRPLYEGKKLWVGSLRELSRLCAVTDTDKRDPSNFRKYGVLPLEKKGIVIRRMSRTSCVSTYILAPDWEEKLRVYEPDSLGGKDAQQL